MVRAAVVAVGFEELRQILLRLEPSFDAFHRFGILRSVADAVADEQTVFAILNRRQIDENRGARLEDAVGDGGAARVAEIIRFGDEIPLRGVEVHVGLAHVGEEDLVVLPIRAEHFRERCFRIDGKHCGYEICRQNIAFAGIACAAGESLGGLQEGDGIPAVLPVDVQEGGGEGVQFLGFHPVADADAGFGGRLVGFRRQFVRDEAFFVRFHFGGDLLVEVRVGRLVLLVVCDDGHVEVLLQFVVRDGEIAHAFKRLADDADAGVAEFRRGCGGFKGGLQLGGDDGGMLPVAGDQDERLLPADEEVGEILHAVDAVVRADLLAAVDVEVEIVVRRRVQNDDRDVRSRDGVDGFQRRRIGEMERHNGVHLVVFQQLDGFFKLRLDAGDGGLDDFDAKFADFLRDEIRVGLHLRAALGVCFVVKSDVEWQKTNFCWHVFSPCQMEKLAVYEDDITLIKIRRLNNMP